MLGLPCSISRLLEGLLLQGLQIPLPAAHVHVRLHGHGLLVEGLRVQRLQRHSKSLLLVLVVVVVLLRPS